MMYGFFVIEQECKMHMQALRRESEKHRLLREAGRYRRGWWSRQVCSLLRRLGRRLETLGQQLQRVGQPGAVVLEMQVNSGVLAGNGARSDQESSGFHFFIRGWYRISDSDDQAGAGSA